MTNDEFKKLKEKQVMEYYEKISDDIKEDLVFALEWANKTLTEIEAGDYIFEILACGELKVCCTFSDPRWAADHCGRGMDCGSQAIVMAVSEYVNGM